MQEVKAALEGKVESFTSGYRLHTVELPENVTHYNTKWLFKSPIVFENNLSGLFGKTTQG